MIQPSSMGNGVGASRSLHTHTSTVETTGLTKLFDELKENAMKELHDTNMDRKLLEHEKRQQDQKLNDQKQKLIEQEAALKGQRQTIEDDWKNLNNQKQQLDEQEEALKSQRQALEDDRQKWTKDVDALKQELENQNQKRATMSLTVQQQQQQCKEASERLQKRSEKLNAYYKGQKVLHKGKAVRGIGTGGRGGIQVLLVLSRQGIVHQQCPFSNERNSQI